MKTFYISLDRFKGDLINSKRHPFLNDARDDAKRYCQEHETHVVICKAFELVEPDEPKIIHTKITGHEIWTEPKS